MQTIRRECITRVHDSNFAAKLVFLHFSKSSFSITVPVKLREVHLKPNKIANNDDSGFSTSQEVIFYCFPMLDGIVDPHTVVIDVEWWVEDQLVIEESFNLKARSSGILQPQFWKMGQTVSHYYALTSQNLSELVKTGSDVAAQQQ